MTFWPDRLCRHRRWAAICGLSLLLAACQSGTPSLPSAGIAADFSDEIIDLKGRSGPPKGPEGACWIADTHPAVIETVTEQVLVSAEQRDAQGQIIKPSIYASETRQRMLRDRGEIWFRAPCPERITPEFIATLQRALKARGLYLQPLTGVMDSDTKTALGRYQRARGLDSELLSLAASRELGLISPDWGL